jgi:hypothetical protein
VSTLPRTDRALVLRTDFSDDAAWIRICSAIAAPVGDFLADVQFVDDRQHDCLTTEQVLRLSPDASDRAFIFLVDAETIARPDHPILVVDLFHVRGRSFRVVPPAMWSLENNLSIANMDWEDFAENVDPDGVFRGF